MGTSPQQLLRNSSSTHPYCTPQNYRFISSRQEPCSPLPSPLAQLSLCTELPLLCWLRWRRIFFILTKKKKGKIVKEQYHVVCVCVFSSHPFWTSSSLDVPAGVTQEEGHTGFLIHLPSAVRALIFVARRIQPFLSLVDREVEFCVLTN